jgi:hypothetical protein
VGLTWRKVLLVFAAKTRYTLTSVNAVEMLMRQTQKLFAVATLTLALGLFCISYGFLNLYFYLIDKTWINLVWLGFFLPFSAMPLMVSRWAAEKRSFIKEQTRLNKG